MGKEYNDEDDLIFEVEYMNGEQFSNLFEFRYKFKTLIFLKISYYFY